MKTTQSAKIFTIQFFIFLRKIRLFFLFFITNPQNIPFTMSSFARRDRGSFKAGVSNDDSRRRREDTSVCLRKSKREEGLAGRQMASAPETPAPAGRRRARRDAGCAGPPDLHGGRSQARRRDRGSVRVGGSAERRDRAPGREGLPPHPLHRAEPPVWRSTRRRAPLHRLPHAPDAVDLQLSAWALTNIASTDQVRHKK